METVTHDKKGVKVDCGNNVSWRAEQVLTPSLNGLQANTNKSEKEGEGERRRRKFGISSTNYW
jgi:hypothetical protein